MAEESANWDEENTGRVADALVKLGQIGFWVQLIFLIIVVVLGGVVLGVVGGGAGVGNVLSFLGLILPAFTTFWCWHYLSLGRKLKETGDDPSAARLQSRVWIGVWVGTIGAVLTIVSLFGAAFALLVTMLANPQVGLQISAAETGASPYTISAVDAVSIMTLLLTLTAELLVVAISLRIVFLISRSLGGNDV